MGRQYYVIPYCLQLPKVYYSELLRSKPNTTSIVLPDVDGPIEEFISCLYSENFDNIIKTDNCKFYFAIGSALAIEELVRLSQPDVLSFPIEEVVDLAIKMAEKEIYKPALTNQLAQNFQAVLETEAIKRAPVGLIENIRKSELYNLHTPIAFSEYYLVKSITDKLFKEKFETYLKDSAELKTSSFISRLLKLPNVNLSKFDTTLHQLLSSCVEKNETYEYSESNKLNGFFASQANRKTDFSLEASSVYNSNYNISNIIDYKNEAFLYCSSSLTNPNEFFVLKFENSSFLLHGYEVLGAVSKGTCIGPISWRVEGSNDEQEWTLIDERTNDKSIVDSLGPVYFKCTETVNYFRCIKFTQIQNNAKANKRLIISKFEIYGNYLDICSRAREKI